MAGWIKLHRKLKENGHLKMPGAAFKLWVLCLLEASPGSNRALGLEAGELWLTYGYISESIGEENKTISKSTISSALKYLEANGYIQTQAQKFKGIKVRVINWQGYQGGQGPQGLGTNTVPGDTLAGTSTVPDTETSGTPKSPSGTENALYGTPAVPGDMLSSTPAVPTDMLPGTSTVPNTETTGTLKEPTGTENALYGTPAVPGAPLNPWGDKPRRLPIRNKNKELRNINTAAAVIVTRFEKELGRPLSPIEAEKIAEWQEKTRPEMILEALSRAVLKDRRNMAYISGILSNWQKFGVDTLAKVKEQDEKHRRQNKGPPGPKEPGASEDETSLQLKRQKKELIKSLYRN